MSARTERIATSFQEVFVFAPETRRQGGQPGKAAPPPGKPGGCSAVSIGIPRLTSNQTDVTLREVTFEILEGAIALWLSFHCRGASRSK